MKKNNLHLIEPTLQDYTGHCHSYINALLEAFQKNPKDYPFTFTTWVGRKAKNLMFADKKNVRYFFIYKIRKLQQVYLYYRLIKQNQNLFIPTSGSFDLKLLIALLNKNKAYNGKLFLHFHQIRPTKDRTPLIKKCQQHPQIILLTTTDKLTNQLKSMGAPSAYTLPCPGFCSIKKDVTKTSTATVKLLYTGAARDDKGFPEVVGLVDYMATTNQLIPIHIQAPAPHNNRFDKRTENALDTLKAINYSALTIGNYSLDQTQYLALFQNAICLLIYDPVEYATKFSGVTLEAIYRQCPIITVAGTWIADVVAQFQAGIIVDNRDPKTVFDAVKKIMRHYQHYQANTQKAANVLQEQHRPETTLLFLAKMLT